MPDIDGFLDSIETAPAPEPAPEPVATETVAPATEGVIAEPPAAELPPRGEDGRWIKSEPAEPPQRPQGHQVPLDALLAEREKRQAAERALAEKTQAEPKPDFWENPEAAVAAQVKGVEQRILEESEVRAEARARQLFLSYTENAARGKYTDYDAMRSVFAEEAAKNPVLATQLREAPDPAEFIYRQGRTAAELREVGGDLGAYKQRLEEKIRAEVEAKYAAKAAKLGSVPQSLNSEPSKGAGITGAVWNGPTPLEDILPFKRQ